jgi:hypothetical protein
MNLSGSLVNGWVTLPQPRAYYIYPIDADGHLVEYTDAPRLTADCTAASDSTVNFGNFVGINMIFNQALGNWGWEGGSSHWDMTLEGQWRGWRVTWIGLPEDNYKFVFAELAHAMGHGFGLSSSSGQYGLSAWDVMSTYEFAHYDPSIGLYNPQGTISYAKYLADWIPPSRVFIPTLGSTTTITLERLANPISSATYLMASIPIRERTSGSYTVEFRQLVGHDVGVPGTAVLIHHKRADSDYSWSPPTVVDEDNNGNPNDAGAMWTPGETFADAANEIFVTVNSFNATSATVTISVSAKTPGTRELILDFGVGDGGGIWSYRWGWAWTQLHTNSPEGMVTGDLDGNGQDDLILDYGNSGVWAWLNNSAWSPIVPSSLDPSHLVTGDLDGNGRDEIVFDFPGAGTWILYDNATWRQIHAQNSVRFEIGNIDGSAGDDLIVEFAGQGIWSFRNNSTWAQIHHTNALAIGVGDIDGSGRDDVIIAFQSGGGTWSYLNDTSWAFIHGTAVTLIAAGDMDGSGRHELALSFPGSGIWILTNGSTWSQLHPINPDSILFVDVDGSGRSDVVVDFGVGNGIWTFMNNTAWVEVHPLSPEIMTSADLVP